MKNLMLIVWLLAFPALADEATDRFLRIMTLVHAGKLQDPDARAIAKDFEAAQKVIIAESNDAICAQRLYYAYQSDGLASALEVRDVRIDALMTLALNQLESKLAKKPKRRAEFEAVVDSTIVEVHKHPDNYDYIRNSMNNTELVTKICGPEAWTASAQASREDDR